MDEPVKGLPPTNTREENRRTFLSKASSLAMAGGLVSGYGALAVVAGKFLYPNQPRKLAWIFVAESASLKLNDTIPFQTPAGQRVLITRRADQGTVDDFLALSTVCPHLGCQVHWEPQNRRFFCPCHNGAFDPSGRATEGPPADAGQSLPTFPLKLENGLIFIQVPADTWG